MKKHFYQISKRFIDFIAAFVLLVVLFPLLIISSVAIKVDSKGPIIFKQKRFGKNKKFFTIFKFRTMYMDAPKDLPTHQFGDSKKWTTRVGWFLRKTNIDELPQLINILLGQMSFVGPRPALWNQNDLIDERDKYRANDAIVGLTGWAQIHSLNEIPIKEKAALDGEYIKKASICFDSYIVISTLLFVFKRAKLYRKKDKKL